MGSRKAFVERLCFLLEKDQQTSLPLVTF